jgi:hypothetical protein
MHFLLCKYKVTVHDAHEIDELAHVKHDLSHS